VFARYPEAGRAKTRLIPELGAEGAAALSQELTDRTLRIVKRAATELGADLTVYFTGCDADRMRAAFPGNYGYRDQSDGDLGERMYAAFDTAFAEGYAPVVLVGTDCPELTEELITSAFDQLTDHDVALGPAADGGYYLIALRAPVPVLFKGIDWGSASVFETTVSAANNHGLSVATLPLLRDIDRPEDVRYYESLKDTEIPAT
jgi:rSAM/selenodomain-associated transferase 1